LRYRVAVRHQPGEIGEAQIVGLGDEPLRRLCDFCQLARLHAETWALAGFSNDALRLAPDVIDRLTAISGQKGIGYQTLIRMWVMERLAQESG
jgi:hypothetical protein